LAKQVEHGVIKTGVRKGRANKLDETPIKAGGVTLSWERSVSVTGLDPEWGRRRGFCDRIGITIGARLAILPQLGGWGDFGGHDATTRAEREAVGRRALPKPWLNFKLASGLWPASRCSPSANQTPRPSLSLKRSLAPSAKESRTGGVRPQSCALLGIVTMNLSHSLFLRTLRRQGILSHPPLLKLAVNQDSS
jgi:hypothetical protein